MRKKILILASFSVITFCAQDAGTQTEYNIATAADAGCTIISSDHKGFYVGINTCLSDSSFKANLQKRLRNHKVIKYTDNATTFESYYTKTFITLNNAVFAMPGRFDVWDAYVLFAAKSANPYKSGAHCASGKILDWYDYQCYDTPSEIMSASTGGQQNPGSTDTLGVPVANFGTTGLYDREHSWPASWFRDDTAAVNDPAAGSYCFNGNNDSFYPSGEYPDYRAYTDLHHLIPARRAINGLRSNFVPGIVDVNEANFPRTNGTKFGTPKTADMAGFPGATGNAAKVFEPPAELKGDFARNYFYMATRYYTEDSCWKTNEGVTRANINTWLETVLKTWHNNDPVSAEEKVRNDWIHRIQGNRNPFVDHPEWVAKISDF